MRPLGFNFKKIYIEKKKELLGNVNININIQIKDINQNKTNLFEEKDTLSFDYEFKISYQPDFAELIFEGSILILFEDKELVKKILKEWKNKKVTEDIQLQILNIVFNRCHLKALELEEEIGLPLHHTPPRLTNLKKE